MVELAFSFFVPASCMPHDIVTTARKVREIHYYKAIYWDGSGLWLLAKKLESGRFVWPPIVDGAMTLTPAQLAVLVEAMDWRRTIAPPEPSRPMLV
jgi:transposase